MKKFVSWVLVLTLALGSLAGCSDSKKKKKSEEKEKKEKIEETEDSDRSDPDEPVSYKIDDLDGLWLDEHGPFLYVQSGKRDMLLCRESMEFFLEDFDGEGVTCSLQGESALLYTSSEFLFPYFTGTSLHFPISMYADGTIDFMGRKLFREDSDEGKALIKKIDSILLSDTFYYTDQEMSITFDKDNMYFETADYSSSNSAHCENGLVQFESFSTLQVLCAYLPDPDADTLLIYYIQAVFTNTPDRAGMQAFLENTDFVSSDPDDNEIHFWNMSGDQLIEQDASGNELSRRTIKDYSYNSFTASDGFLSCDTISAIEYSPSNRSRMALYPDWSIMGILTQLREEVRNGTKKNQVFTTNKTDYLGTAEQITVTFDLGGKALEDVWVPDLGSVSILSQFYSFIVDDDSLISSQVTIQPGPLYSGAQIVFELDTSLDGANFVIINIEDPSGPEYTCDVSTSQNGIMLVFDVPGAGTYVVRDSNIKKADDTLYDVETVLSTDPKETRWALTHDTGDILDLVDLEYIENSIIDMETGSAEFWISTPEEFASFTYYVNVHEVTDTDSIDKRTMYYVHLLNDIDISEYTWVKIGHSDPGQSIYIDTHYQGIFFGNGYSIKGLTIPDADASLFERSHLSTIIGLTLDHPVLGENTHEVNCFCDDGCCIMEFFDCHVIIDEDQADLYSFASHENESLNFFDCTFEVQSGNSTSKLSMKGYADYYYNGYDNWIYRYYMDLDNLCYKYDAAGEYADYLSDPDLFTDLRYYYGGEAAEEHTGYLDFQGWLVDNEFFLNFGFVYYA